MIMAVVATMRMIKMILGQVDDEGAFKRLQ